VRCRSSIVAREYRRPLPRSLSQLSRHDLLLGRARQNRAGGARLAVPPP
jgi:hypothetical protein